MYRPLIIALSPEVPLLGDSDTGMGCGVLGVTWGVVPGVGPMGWGSVEGPHGAFCLL